MSQAPKRAGETPLIVALEAEKTYYFCTCGHSLDQPFCDGSHATTGKATGCTPQAFSVPRSKKYWLCPCKAADGPFCDGSHSKPPCQNQPYAETNTNTNKKEKPDH